MLQNSPIMTKIQKNNCIFTHGMMCNYDNGCTKTDQAAEL